MRELVFALTVVLAVAASRPAMAINLVLDYTLNENNQTGSVTPRQGWPVVRQ